MCFCNKWNEYEKCKFLADNNPELDDFLRKRAKVSLKYFIKKANCYKNWGAVMSVLNIILPAVATYLSVYAVQNNNAECIKFITSIITFITTIIVSMIALFKFTEKKNSYRNSAEQLKSELVMFYEKTGDYDNSALKVPDTTAQDNTNNNNRNPNEESCNSNNSVDEMSGSVNCSGQKISESNLNENKSDKIDPYKERRRKLFVRRMESIIGNSYKKIIELEKDNK